MNRTIVAAMLLLVGTGAAAQSTANVGRAERPLQLEVSIGRSTSGHQGIDPGAELTASLGARWKAGGSGGFRLIVHGMSRRTDWYTSAYNASGRTADTIRTTERTLAVVLAADVGLRLWGDLVGSISAGAGVIPYAHGGQTGSSEPDSRYYGNYSVSDAGILVTGGLMLRYRWLFVEQAAHFPWGTDEALRVGREYFPISVGVRF